MPQFITSDSGHHHMMILGTSGRGRSLLLQAEADRLGISYDELLKRMEPTPEQKEQARMRGEEKKQRDNARLNAVREAYWAATSADDSDLYRLHDALVSTVMQESPTLEQQKALFMMLPPQIVGLGIAWGFGDTEVGDDIYRFIEENRDAVIERLGLKN